MLKNINILNNFITFIENLLNIKINNIKNNNYKHLIKNYNIKDISYYSFHKPFLILKHSERCIISRNIMKEFIKFHKYNTDRFNYLVIDVIDNKLLSNSVAEEYKIIHQSPQILLIKEGSCVYNESHNEINFNIIDNNF